jgi:hypothetical protein
VNFDVYCDESGPELLCSENPKSRYLVIGSLWLPQERRDEFKKALHNLRQRHHIGSEFKWRKVSPSRLRFYRDCVDWFFAAGDDLRFRAWLFESRGRLDPPVDRSLDPAPPLRGF